MDVKPDNILIKDWTVKISDFGISKMLIPGKVFDYEKIAKSVMIPEFINQTEITDKVDSF